MDGVSRSVFPRGKTLVKLAVSACCFLFANVLTLHVLLCQFKRNTAARIKHIRDYHSIEPPLSRAWISSPSLLHGLFSFYGVFLFIVRFLFLQITIEQVLNIKWWKRKEKSENHQHFFLHWPAVKSLSVARTAKILSIARTAARHESQDGPIEFVFWPKRCSYIFVAQRLSDAVACW